MISPDLSSQPRDDKSKKTRRSWDVLISHSPIYVLFKMILQDAFYFLHFIASYLAKLI